MAKKRTSNKGKGKSLPRGARVRGPAIYSPGTDPVAADTFAMGRPDPLYNFRDPLTPADARASTEAAARLRYGPQEAQLASQMRGVGQRYQNVTNWFDQYKNDLEKAKAAQAAYYQGAQDQNAKLVQQAAAQAPLQGEQSKQQQADSANAASVRQGLAESFGQLLTAQLGAQNDYLANRQGVGSAAQLSERLKTDAMMRDLYGQGGEIAAEKGAFKTQYAGDLRDKERQYQDTLHRQQLEDKAFGLDVSKAQADADAKAGEVNKYGYTTAQWAAMTPEQRKKIIRSFQPKPAKPKEGNNFGYTDRQWAKMSPEQKRQAKARWDRAGDKPEGTSPAERSRVARVREKSDKALTRLEDARSDWDRFAGMRDDKGRRPTPSQIKSRMRDEGYSAAEIHLALMDRARKPWTAREVSMAHRLGIRVPRNRLQSASASKPIYSKGEGRPD